jgi:L-threonylcarbamoyladenylate synthase
VSLSSDHPRLPELPPANGGDDAAAEPGRIWPTHTPALFDRAVRQAVTLLRAGEVVALPTETVYGLAANAYDARAVARIFALKGRPAHNPLIVHVSGVEMARQSAAAWPETAARLAAAFWPGPLTLVVPRAPALPDLVTAGGPTVGVRCPAHPLMQAVIRECGFPLAAPSANRANQLSPTTAAHVDNALGERLPLIVDGGACQVGIESTVVDLTVSPWRVLRPGMIHEAALRAALGPAQAPTEARMQADAGDVLRSPGQLKTHYAPRARLLVRAWRDEADLREQVNAFGGRIGGCFVLAHTNIPSARDWGGISVIPHDAEAYARALYGELHRCDAAGAEWIVAEAVPDEPEWQGIADRLFRASALEPYRSK